MSSPPEQPYKYVDRAKQRRRAEHSDTAQPFTHINTEQSKYLGGDIDTTHYVKGLDVALLNKTKYELQQQNLLPTTQAAQHAQHADAAEHKSLEAATTQSADPVQAILDALQKQVDDRALIQQSLNTRYTFDTTYRVPLNQVFVPPVAQLSAEQYVDDKKMLHEPSAELLQTLYSIYNSAPTTVPDSPPVQPVAVQADNVTYDSDDDMFGDSADTATAARTEPAIDLTKQPLFSDTKTAEPQPATDQQPPVKRTYIESSSDSDDDAAILQASRQRTLHSSMYDDGESKSMFASAYDSDSDAEDDGNKPRRGKLNQEFQQVVGVMSSKNEKYKVLLTDKSDSKAVQQPDSKRAKILNVKR